MNTTISIETGLAAFFRQPAGPSRPGIDWIVRIDGEKSQRVVVRTYSSSGTPQDAEKKILAEKAATFVRRKLEQGWTPQPGASLEAD